LKICKLYKSEFSLVIPFYSRVRNTAKGQQYGCAKMRMVEYEYQDGVAVLKLNNGITNPINLALVHELSNSISNVKENSNIHSLVLSGSNEKFFSLGFNIPELFKLDWEGFREFYRGYNRLCLDLYTMPKPTIAAIRGHAIAGGCILTICCDHRFISEGRKLMGLNEIKLGVPIPYPGDRILYQLIGDRHAYEMISTGEFYQSQDLYRMGLVDEIVPQEQLLARSIEKVRSVGIMSENAYRLINENRTGPVAEQVSRHLQKQEERFLNCWFLPSTRENLKEAMKKF